MKDSSKTHKQRIKARTKCKSLKEIVRNKPELIVEKEEFDKLLLSMTKGK